MIPQPVYDNILYASCVNHGADLTRSFKTGKKVFSLKKDYHGISGPAFVKASLYIHVATDAELDAYETKGYEVFRNSPHSGPFAVRTIALGQIPDSKVKEWNQWDEY